MNQWKKIIGMAMLLSASNAWGAIDVVNDFNGIFDVSFLNAGDTTKSGPGSNPNLSSKRDWTDTQKQIVFSALNYWDSIIYNTPGRNITVGLLWSDRPLQNVNGNISNPNKASNNYINRRTVAADQYSGIRYNGDITYCETYAESIWRGGYTGGGSPYYDYDILIEFGSDINFVYSLEKPSLTQEQDDFYAAVTHELGHSFGFGTGNSPGSINYYNAGYTSFDLLGHVEGESNTYDKVVKFSSPIPPSGKNIILGEAQSLALDSSFAGGFSHVKNASGYADPVNLMTNGFKTTTEPRELTSQELRLMKEMGWAMEPLPVPEPASASLGLLGLSALLLRRRR